MKTFWLGFEKQAGVAASYQRLPFFNKLPKELRSRSNVLERKSKDLDKRQTMHNVSEHMPLPGNMPYSQMAAKRNKIRNTSGERLNKAQDSLPKEEIKYNEDVNKYRPGRITNALKDKKERERSKYWAYTVF